MGCWHGCFLQKLQVCRLSLASCYSQDACQVIWRLEKKANFLIWSGVIFETVACEPLPSSFTAGCFQLNSCKLESVQWFWPSSAPEVLQKKPGPLYSNFKPFFWCCPLFVDLPRPWLLLWCTCVLQYLKKKIKKIFRMCCLIAAPYNPSCTPGDVYLVFLSLLHGKKRKGKLSYERGLQW